MRSSLESISIHHQLLVMEDIRKLDLSTLIDLLAKHTNEYMKMLKDSYTDEEYENCKSLIKKLTVEIEYIKEKEMPTQKGQNYKSRDKI